MMPFFSEESFGALLGSPFQSEASSPLRFHPYTERDDFMEYDYHFQRSCCFSESDMMCPTYTNQRRADECLSYTPSEFGKLFYIIIIRYCNESIIIQTIYMIVQCRLKNVHLQSYYYNIPVSCVIE